MNVEKLKRLQSQVRIGGKGTPRRKKKVMHQTAAADDKKLQSSLKKLSVSTIPGIEEVNIIKDDLTVIHFNNPKAQASLSANTFAVTGHGETKKVVEMLPEILPQLGPETVAQLRMFASSMTNNQKEVCDKFGSNMLGNIDEDDVPLMVNDFDEIAKKEDLTKGKKRDRKDDSQHPKNVSANAKALNIQENLFSQGGKNPNENNGSTFLVESPKVKIEKQAVPTDGNLKPKASDKSKNAPTPGKSEKKELNAQKGGGNLRPQKTTENVKHEPNKVANLKAAANYDVKDILDNLPLNEVKAINVDNFAYVDRNVVNPSTVKSTIAPTCPVQDVSLQPKLSPIDNASNIKNVALEGVKPNLIESQLTDVMVLEESKSKEIQKSNHHSKQMMQIVNLNLDNKKGVDKDGKKAHDTQLSGAEVVTKSCLSLGDNIGDLRGMHIAAVPGMGSAVKLENKTEVIKDVAAAIIPAPNVVSFKKEEGIIQKNPYEANPVTAAPSLENKTGTVQQQVTQNNTLQTVAENTARLVAATLGLENKENVQGLGADKNQVTIPLSLACKPAEVKVVQDASPISILGLENITNIKELHNVAIPLHPPKDIMQTKNTPKEPKVETLKYPAKNLDMQKSPEEIVKITDASILNEQMVPIQEISKQSPVLQPKPQPNVSMQKSPEEIVKITDASILKEQMVPTEEISKQPSVVQPKPQPTVSPKTAIQKAPQKKGPINKDTTGKQQQVKTSSPTTPIKITIDPKKGDVAAKSKPAKPQAPSTPPPSTGGATPKPQSTPKLPASPASKQEKPAMTTKVKPTMSPQTKQPSNTSPKPATTLQQKKVVASPPSSDPSVKAGTPMKATPMTPEPTVATASAKPKPDNNIKDKQPNLQHAGAAEPATKSASPSKATQQNVSDDQIKKPSQ